MMNEDKNEKDRFVITKHVNGKDYLYIKFPFDVSGQKTKNIELYVAPKDTEREELRCRFCLIYGKLLLEILKRLYEYSKKHSLNYITDEQLKRLETLRFFYNFFLKEFAKSDLERYDEKVYTKYVYGTTSIEGNTYDLRETDLTLNEGMTVAGKEKREFYEVENYRKLKEFEEKNIKTFKITPQLIKKIHSLVMANIDDDAAGSFRRIDVGIRGTDFVPTPYIMIDEEIEKLCKWFAENEDKSHPIELASMFHQKFEEIHPFKDGNGRVGRELLRLTLKENGFPTIFIDNSQREAYLKAIDKGNDGDFNILIQFIIKNLLTVHKELLDRAEKQIKEIVEKQEIMCKKCSLKENECQKLKNEIIDSGFIVTPD